MVVERGLARCPRCVSVADYVFIETKADGPVNGMRYEVRCRKCGECYGEETRVFATRQVAATESPIAWPRDHEPLEPRDWRLEVQEKLTEVRDKVSVARQRSAPVIDEMVRRTRTYAPKRWFGRKEEDVLVG